MNPGMHCQLKPASVESRLVKGHVTEIWRAICLALRLLLVRPTFNECMWLMQRKMHLNRRRVAHVHYVPTQYYLCLSFGRTRATNDVEITMGAESQRIVENKVGESWSR